MTDEIKVFDFEGKSVRTVTINNTPYFLGKDVAMILGYKDLNRALNQHVEKENRKSLSLKASGDSYLSLWEGENDFSNKTVINEAGVYDLIFGSELPSAKRFKHWVTHEVLPDIRKHGAYMTDEKAFDVVNNKDGLAELLQQAADQLKAKDIQIKEMQPKAIFADAVATSKTDILIGELAKIIKQNGVHLIENHGKLVSMGQNHFFEWLREKGYLVKRQGTDYNAPTQMAMNKGLFRVKESQHSSGDGAVLITKITKVTGKGQQYFINKFLETEA